MLCAYFVTCIDIWVSIHHTPTKYILISVFQPGHGGDGGGEGDGKPKRAQMSYNALMQVSCLEVVFFSLLTLILMVGGVVLGLYYSMILGWSLFGFGTLVALFLLGTFTVGKFQMHKQRAMYAKMAAKEVYENNF